MTNFAQKKLILYTKILLGVVFGFIFMSAGLRVFSFAPANNPIEKYSLRVILSQNNDQVSLKNIDTVPLYGSDYKLNIPNDYYTIKIFNASNTELFSGRVVNTDHMIAESYDPNTKQLVGSSSSNPLAEITMYLPYYKSADRIVVYDEKKQEKLTIKLKDYNLTKPPEKVNLCGNGICDTTENSLSCTADCL